MKHVFIVNPVSGKGKGNGFIPAIEEYFKQSEEKYEIRLTEKPQHATEIAKEYTENDDVILYAVGGDGTMKEVIDGLNDNVRFCVLPGGTGNDFYKNVTLNQYTEKEIIEAAVNGVDEDIDYGLFNGTSKFLNIVSFGLDAYINEYACDVVKQQKTLIPDNMVYAYSTLKVGLHPETYHMVCEVDGKKYEDDTIIMAIANGTYYGGTFNAFPKAELTDGLFNSSYFRPMKLLRLIKCILLYMKGKHTGEKECSAFTGKNYRIEFDRPIPCQVDGENCRVTSAVVEMQAGKLKFRRPVFKA